MGGIRFHWSDAWSVGVASIDAEHKAFAGQINQLADLVQTSVDKCRITQTLADIVTEAISHFANEEQILLDSAFPGLVLHKMEHERILGEVADHQAAFAESEDRDDWKERTQSIMSLLVEHLIDFDMQYKWYFQDQPSRAPRDTHHNL